MIKIKGMYKQDSNFTTVCCDNTVYTIASTGDWGCVTVGQVTAMGQVLTQEWYNKILSECVEEGTFTLSE